MASAIQTQSSTLEGQFLEILTNLLELEKTPETNPKQLHNFVTQWSISTDKFTCQGSFLLNLLGETNSQGQLILSVDPYLVDLNTPEAQ